jgi:glycosidase
MQKREADWRIGPVVYQVFVDRFAPSASIGAKAEFYKSPRRLMGWDRPPERGVNRPEVGVWSHELDFWGGDLASLQGKLGHVADLADVLYLNPIHDALTNHKYDATHWDRIAPEYGDWTGFEALASDVHGRKMRLVLDGVFNHCGKSNPMFKDALGDEKSQYRDWFTFDKALPHGYRAWAGVANLPEVKLENIATRKHLWLDDGSVVAKYLKAGADGWRLDVAHELGFEFLKELTESAHRHKADSLVIGEAWNYPSRWTENMDGILSMFLGRLILDYTRGHFSSRQFADGLKEMIADCGIEPVLRSWVVLGNHDTERLATTLPKPAERRFAQALQFVLPGAPLLYYGDELGMVGEGDPLQRAPMRWDLVDEKNADLAWTRKLAKLRHSVRAIRIGDCRVMSSEKALAFLRTTERPLEAAIVLANPTPAPITESWVVPDPTLMGFTLLRDVLNGETVRVQAGTLRVTIPAQTVRVFIIDDEAAPRGQYKRMKDG